jgi:endosialidase-like protein
MAITTYAELKSAIASWLARDDLSAAIPDFVALFEAAANRRLRVRQMEISATLAPADGAAPLPADYLMWRRLTWTGSRRRELDYVHPSYLQAAFDGSAGTPRVFTIEGSTLKIRPAEGTALELDYFQKIPPLSDAQTSNWLLAAHPDLYLLSQSALNAADSPEERLLALEQRRRMLPLQNLGLLANLIVPMAQLGGTKITDSTETGERKEPLLQQLLGGASLLGKAGAFGPQGWLYSGTGSLLSGAGAAGAGAASSGISAALPLIMSGIASDRRLKQNIAVVGALYDGTPVYRFRYLGDPAMRIGLMADDVEKVVPEAVHLVNAFKFVDYQLATQRVADR